MIVVALGVPYDLLYFPNVSTYLATYGVSPNTMRVLGEVFSGRYRPVGKLPVELPGLYVAGHGLN